MAYLKPELQLVGAAQSLVLEGTGIPVLNLPKSERTSCNDEDAEQFYADPPNW